MNEEKLKQLKRTYVKLRLRQANAPKKPTKDPYGFLVQDINQVWIDWCIKKTEREIKELENPIAQK